MNDLVLTTFAWVPEPPRGYVRDIRIRWALEEAGLPYRVVGVPFTDRTREHFEHQPFGQVPWLIDGDLSIFESGAILLHLGDLSPSLMPADRRARSEAREWLVAALNSVEPATVPWTLFQFSDEKAGLAPVEAFLRLRLSQLEPVFARQDWLAGRFSVADILMADVLRLVDRFEGLADFPEARAYVARATARPAFSKAYRDQIAHFDRAQPPENTDR